MTSHVATDAQYAALAQRVTGIEAAIGNLSAQITGLSSSLSEKSKTPWGLIYGGATFFLSVLVAVGGVVAWGLLSQMENMTRAHDDFKLETRAVLSASVPRGEHERVWLADNQRFEDIQRQIDLVRSDLASVYTPGRAFEDIIDRVDRLERFRLGDDNRRKPE